MPSKAVIEAEYIKVGTVVSNAGGTAASAIPLFGGTSTTGVSPSLSPAAGHVLRNAITGTEYRQLPVQRNVTMYAAFPDNRYELVERFQRRPVLNADLASGTEATREPANPDFEVLGTNATSALTTFADGGGITLTTAGANNDFNVIAPHLDTAQTAWAAAKWNTNDEIGFKTVIKTGASVASIKIWAGFKLTNTSVTATDDDSAYFLFDTGNTNSVSATNIQLCTSRAGTDTVVDSGITVQASTHYVLEIQVDVNRIPYFFINGVCVGVGNGTDLAGVTTSTGALTADIDLIPYVGVMALTAAAKAVTIRALICGKSLND